MICLVCLPCRPTRRPACLPCAYPTVLAFFPLREAEWLEPRTQAPPAPRSTDRDYEYQPSLQPNPPSPAAIPSSPPPSPPPPSSLRRARPPACSRVLFAAHTLVCFCPPVIIPPRRPGPSLLHLTYLPWTLLRLTERDAAACILRLSSSPHTTAARR
jgi:hypothetical protein